MEDDFFWQLDWPFLRISPLYICYSGHDRHACFSRNSVFKIGFFPFLGLRRHISPFLPTRASFSPEIYTLSLIFLPLLDSLDCSLFLYPWQHQLLWKLPEPSSRVAENHLSRSKDSLHLFDRALRWRVVRGWTSCKSPEMKRDEDRKWNIKPCARYRHFRALNLIILSQPYRPIHGYILGPSHASRPVQRMKVHFLVPSENPSLRKYSSLPHSPALHWMAKPRKRCVVKLGCVMNRDIEISKGFLHAGNQFMFFY